MVRLLLLSLCCWSTCCLAAFTYDVSTIKLEDWFIWRVKIDDHGTVAATVTSEVNSGPGLAVIPKEGSYSVLAEGTLSNKWLCDVNGAGEVLFGDKTSYTIWYPDNQWEEVNLGSGKEGGAHWPIGLLEGGYAVYAYRSLATVGLTFFRKGESIENISLSKAFAELNFPIGSGIIPTRITDYGVILCQISGKDRQTFNLFDTQEMRFLLPGGFPENKKLAHLTPMNINTEEMVILEGYGPAEGEIYCWCHDQGYHYLLPSDEETQGTHASVEACSDGEYFVGLFWHRQEPKTKHPFIANQQGDAWKLNDCLNEDAIEEWRIIRPKAVNARGQIVATALCLTDHTTHLILLNPK